MKTQTIFAVEIKNTEIFNFLNSLVETAYSESTYCSFGHWIGARIESGEIALPECLDEFEVIGEANRIF